MSIQPEHRSSLFRGLTVLLVVVFFVWSSGVHSSPLFDTASVSSLVADEHGLVDASSDGSPATDDTLVPRLVDRPGQSGLTSSALVQLAFAGPSYRLLSYPRLAQAPPFSR